MKIAPRSEQVGRLVCWGKKNFKYHFFMTLSFFLKTHSRFSKNGIEVVGEGQLVEDVYENPFNNRHRQAKLMKDYELCSEIL